MKLNELDWIDSKTAAQRVLESRFGQSLDLSQLSLSKAYKMLDKTQSAIADQHNSSNGFLRENNAQYMKLILLDKVLRAYIAESDSEMPIDMKNPKVKGVMDKIKRGQNLSPDEQEMANKIAAMSTTESKKVTESTEIQQAQVVLAAKDMSDRVQKMLQDVSEMQFKDLPAIVDGAKNEVGTEQAEQYNTAVTKALQDLLIAMQTAKQDMDMGMNALTGDGMSVPTDSSDELGMDASMDPDADFAVDLETNTEELPEPEEEDSEEIAVGRAER